MPSVIKATAIVNGDGHHPDRCRPAPRVPVHRQQPADPGRPDRRASPAGASATSSTRRSKSRPRRPKRSTSRSPTSTRRSRASQQDSKQTPDQLATYLATHGSSLASLRRQIEGEIAWRRLQQAKIEVTVGDDEVKAVLDKLKASKGTEQYRVGEIFLASTPYTQEQTLQNANKILEQLKAGASFAAYAKQYSEASTAAVGGDLGWVRPEQLPAPLAAVLRADAAEHDQQPDPGPWRCLDPRRAGHPQDPDRRPARRGPQPQADFDQLPEGDDPRAGRAGRGSRSRKRRRASADAAAWTRSLPTSTPRSSRATGSRFATSPRRFSRSCCRCRSVRRPRPSAPSTKASAPSSSADATKSQSNGPTYDDVYSQLNEERTNSRARRYLADLRRDAVIEFRYRRVGKAAGMSSAAPKPLAVSLGDPAGIGPEVIAKCWDFAQ